MGWKVPSEGGGYTFSVYLKADTDNLPVELILGKSNHIVNVDRSWKRYSLTGTGSKEVGWNHISIRPIDAGMLWIDAAQLESGSNPGPYNLSRNDVLRTSGVKNITAGEVVKKSLKRWDQALSVYPEKSFYTNENIALLIVRQKDDLSGKPVKLLVTGDDNGDVIYQATFDLSETGVYHALPLKDLDVGEYIIKVSTKISPNLSRLCSSSTFCLRYVYNLGSSTKLAIWKDCPGRLN